MSDFDIELEDQEEQDGAGTAEVEALQAEVAARIHSEQDRNIGNIVPAYPEMLGGVSAVIEFAVGELKVRHIVVCGHTHCGAMAALLAPASVAAMPTVGSWLTNAHAALAVAETLHERTAGRSINEVLTEQNVLLQMQHLKTHPSVAGAMATGELTISGWVYSIGTGEVRIAEDGQRTFTPIGLELPAGV